MSPSRGTSGTHLLSGGRAELTSACPFAAFRKKDETRLHFHVSIYYIGKI